MSELRQQLWAVMSERGCEANNLNYDEAVEIVRRLAGEKVHGMCIITNDAAHLLSRTEPFKPSTPNSNGKRSKP
ncbi:MAG: hypothetical protein WBP93_12140 [Pyrinomonadaceae bacterium]